MMRRNKIEDRNFIYQIIRQKQDKIIRLNVQLLSEYIKLKESFMSIAFEVPSEKSTISESAETAYQPEVVEIKQKKNYPESLKKITSSNSFIMPSYDKVEITCQFQIDISLLNLLRNPQINQKQQFQSLYLKKIKYCLKDSKLSKQEEINRIYIHLMFSQIENLNQMELLGQNREKIVKISTVFYNTNILNPQCIYNNLEVTSEMQQTPIIKGDLIFTILKQAGINELNNNELRISKSYIDFAVIGNGQQDVYFCPFLIRSIPFNAVCRYFSYCPDIEITQKNYGKTFLQIVEERSDEIDFQHWYNRNVARVITGEWENSELIKLILSGYKNSYIQKLLIGLQGWPGHIDQAVKWLNIYYDGTDWQMRSALRPSIAQVGDKFAINYLIEDIKDHRENVMLCLKAPCQNPHYNQQVFSWHRPKLNEYVSEGLKYLWIHSDFKCYAKSGFYDWKIFMFRRNGKNEGINKIFNITQNKTLQSQVFKTKLHNIRRVQGRIIVQPERTRQLQIHEIYMQCLNQDIFPPKIPSFSDAAKQIQKSKELGVNCIYLMGVFERDTGQFGRQGVKCYKRPQASPLALTCRKSPCNMLGGKQKFLTLMDEAKKHGIKIITDCTTRVSSSRMHHRYNNLILHYIDDYGRKQIFFGCDGRSINYEDTLNLNYRKKQAWDLLISQIQEIIDNYKIDGIYLDNGFAWPQVFQINKEQMYRKETDGLVAYQNNQIFEGQIINKGKDTGYWTSNARSSYPNPFFVMLCKRLWMKYPQLLIVCEGFQNSIDQDKALGVIVSGPIPRLFKMPKALSQTFGINLQDDGTLNKCTPKQIIHLVKWYQQTQKILPKNSIVIQSTTSHAWPYPAYIFRQATWAFIDLFYFLPEIPMTFIGQQNGRAYRTKAASIFYTNTKSKNISQNNNSTGDLKRLNSSFFAGPNKIMQPEQIIKGMNSTLRDPTQIKHLQQNFRRQVGPEFGFDLAQIHKHYKHRSNLRNTIPLLTSGNMIGIGAQHMYGTHTNVLSFAKWNDKQLIIVVINFNNAAIDMHFNLANLKYAFSHAYKSNLVVKFKNIFDDKTQYEHYLVSELMTAKIQTHLQKFCSQIWHLQCCKQQNSLQLAYRDSMKRIQAKLSMQPPRWIHSSILTNELINIVEKTTNKDYFLKGMNCLYERFVKPYDINFNLLISKTHQFWINKNKLSKLFAIFRLIDEAKDIGLEDILKKSIHNLLQGNKLGPIAFVTPETGKWSSVGGLGVMIDQLSKQLVKLGEEVYVLTPYYQYNKKGQTNYLQKEGFKYTQNVTAYAAHLSYQFGIHRGTYHNVNYIWFHNPELFSKPYVGEGAQYVTKQLVFFALGVLETFCSLKIFPSTIVTNDWMCGFVAAYVKNQKYKYVFDGTKFMHICHNLDPLYEGRLYPKFQEGDLNWLIQLPTEQYTEYRSNKLIINPSKCALQNCDNWGTVSNSYKVELLKDSPLAYVLWKHPNPFAFPNGVRKEERLHIINTQTPGDHLLSKQKLQQKYFKFDSLNNDLPLFSFIGRVTKQKGVHLIVDSIQDLLLENNYKVQFLLGGPSDSKQQYAKYCASRMKYLTNKYPKCVWSDPDAFFTDGPLVNIGSDFAMMPSMFQPGGIVQHEFFAGHTPVVAFRTGGLKDTVFQYDYKTMKGNGFNFMSFQLQDFKKCMRRAIDCYKNKKHYEKIRENAFESVIQEQDVAKGWNCQFYRLQNKIYVEWDQVQRQYNALKAKQNQQQVEEHQFQKENKGEFYKQDWDVMKGFKQVLIGASRLKGKNHTFTYKTDVIPRPKQISISGSWNDWNSKQKLTFNQLAKNWTITLNLNPSTYYYKYYVDGQWTLTKDEQTETDINNIVNHVVVID